MLKNFFSTLTRQLWRNRLFTSLNIVGLSVCICVAWIIFRMVSYEYSYDKNIPDSQNIYQVISQSADDKDNKVSGFSGIAKPVVHALQNEVSGIEMVVPTFYKSAHHAIVSNGNHNPEKRVENGDNGIQMVATVSDYFKMLSYHWLAGNASTSLDAPNKVVLTDTRAKVYFPQLKPQEMLGKIIVYDDSVYRTVSGIVAQLSTPNSFSADNNEFIPMDKEDIANNNWGGMNSNDLVYLKPAKGVTTARILDQLNVINEKFNKDNFEKYGYKSWYAVMPLSNKHFEPQYGAQTRTANKKVLNGLMVIAGFLVLLACINYINLSTAQLPSRAKEIGIRKTLGSSTRHLIFRFMGETFLVTSLAAALSFVLTSLAAKLFADFLPKGLFEFMNYGSMATFMFTLIVAISLLSGLYPAWLSSKVKTVNVLKGVTEKTVGRNRFSMRKGLIVFQFFIAQVFIIGSIIIHQQIGYALHKDLGFNKEGIVTVSIPYYVNIDPKYADKQFIMRDELRKNAAISGVSIGNKPMDNSMMGNMLTYYKDTTKIQEGVNMKFGDTEYLKVYNFQLMAGRNFVASDTINEIVINEKAAKVFGFTSPQEAIGKVLSFAGNKSKSLPIVGVVKDFHQFGVQSKIEPVMITTSKRQSSTLNIKLPADVSKWSNSIKVIENEWKKLYTDIPFTYSFYDETIKELYTEEKRTQDLVNAATAIAIIISCLGLFGLATLTAYQRTKEVGIRKVLGASVSGIVQLLSREFLILVLVSAVIATPLAWWMMNTWLEDFAYRIEIKWWLFVLAALAACFIALLTVSYQAIKAAIANPVKSLRTE